MVEPAAPVVCPPIIHSRGPDAAVEHSSMRRTARAPHRDARTAADRDGIRRRGCAGGNATPRGSGRVASRRGETANHVASPDACRCRQRRAQEPRGARRADRRPGRRRSWPALHDRAQLGEVVHGEEQPGVPGGRARQPDVHCSDIWWGDRGAAGGGDWGVPSTTATGTPSSERPLPVVSTSYLVLRLAYEPPEGLVSRSI